MRSTNDNPVDPLGQIGPAIRPEPTKPAPPPSQPFTAGDWAPKGLVISEKPAAPVNPKAPAVDEYTLTILGCI